MKSVFVAGFAAVSAFGLVGCGSSDNPPAADSPTSSAGWGLPNDPSAAAKAAGLKMLGEEMTDVHYHAHLDVIVNGIAVPVPGDIGIDRAKATITALHTHEGSGVVHIESAADVPFTLGQLFTEWGQPLTSKRVGPHTLAEGESLRIYRNGTAVPGDPGGLRLAAHDEVVVWVGRSSDVAPAIPSTYEFKDGL